MDLDRTYDSQFHPHDDTDRMLLAKVDNDAHRTGLNKDSHHPSLQLLSLTFAWARLELEFK